MAQLLNPCGIGNSVDNTGYECGKSLSVPQGAIMVPANAKWTLEDMQDPYAFFLSKIHAVKSQRFYPVFANLYDFAVANASDTTESAPNGTTKLLRLGGYTLTFTFADGGECLAKKLLSFNKQGYAFIVVDDLGQFKVRKNSDGTYSGLKANDLYGSQPSQETYAATYKNILTVNISVEEYVQNAEIFKTDADLTDLMGLLDVDVENLSAPTATTATIGATTECAGSDLYDTNADALAVPEAWKITDETGAPVTISSVVKNDTVGGWTITHASDAGHSLSIALADAATLYGLPTPVTGYEGADSVSIDVPVS